MNKMTAVLGACCLLLIVTGCSRLQLSGGAPDDSRAKSVFADVYPESKSVFSDVYESPDEPKTLVPPTSGSQGDNPNRAPLQKGG